MFLHSVGKAGHYWHMAVYNVKTWLKECHKKELYESCYSSSSSNIDISCRSTVSITVEKKPGEIILHFHL